MIGMTNTILKRKLSFISSMAKACDTGMDEA